MNKHTSGPWKAFKTSSKRCAEVISDRENWEHICELPKLRHPDFWGNAQLIAASPAMYEYILGKANDGDTEAIKIIEAIG